MDSILPALYSFRRCPFAIRARMAVSCAGLQVELREVVLREMPEQLLAISPKGTVPVLQLPDGTLIDESRDIMQWALTLNDPENWMPQGDERQAGTAHLIDENDGPFKYFLDRYKYAERYPEASAADYREKCEAFLVELEGRLSVTANLLGEAVSIADIAIFPFIRQFAHVDKPWFDQTPYPSLQYWLAGFIASSLFADVMHKYSQWHEGDAAVVFPELNH